MENHTPQEFQAQLHRQLAAKMDAGKDLTQAELALLTTLSRQKIEEEKTAQKKLDTIRAINTNGQKANQQGFKSNQQGFVATKTITKDCLEAIDELDGAPGSVMAPRPKAVKAVKATKRSGAKQAPVNGKENKATKAKSKVSCHPFAQNVGRFDFLDKLDYSNVGSALLELIKHRSGKHFYLYREIDSSYGSEIDLECMRVLIVNEGSTVPTLVRNTNKWLLKKQSYEAMNKPICDNEPSKYDMFRSVSSFEEAGWQWLPLDEIRDPPGSRRMPSSEFKQFASHKLVENRVFLLSPNGTRARSVNSLSEDDKEIAQSIRILDCRSEKFPETDDEGRPYVGVSHVKLMSYDGKKQIGEFMYDTLCRQGGPTGDEFKQRPLFKHYADIVFRNDPGRVHAARDHLQSLSEEEIDDADVLDLLYKFVRDTTKQALDDDRAEIKQWGEALLGPYDGNDIDEIQAVKIFPKNFGDVYKDQLLAQGNMTKEEIEAIRVTYALEMNPYGPAKYMFDGETLRFDGTNLQEFLGANQNNADEGSSSEEIQNGDDAATGSSEDSD
ncbi:MAG: hypothetical protein SGILL_007415 [Bacillariaceae sp.]